MATPYYKPAPPPPKRQLGAPPGYGGQGGSQGYYKNSSTGGQQPQAWWQRPGAKAQSGQPIGQYQQQYGQYGNAHDQRMGLLNNPNQDRFYWNQAPTDQAWSGQPMLQGINNQYQGLNIGELPISNEFKNTMVDYRFVDQLSPRAGQMPNPADYYNPSMLGAQNQMQNIFGGGGLYGGPQNNPFMQMGERVLGNMNYGMPNMPNAPNLQGAPTSFNQQYNFGGGRQPQAPQPPQQGGGIGRIPEYRQQQGGGQPPQAPQPQQPQTMNPAQIQQSFADLQAKARSGEMTPYELAQEGAKLRAQMGNTYKGDAGSMMHDETSAQNARDYLAGKPQAPTSDMWDQARRAVSSFKGAVFNDRRGNS